MQPLLGVRAAARQHSGGGCPRNGCGAYWRRRAEPGVLQVGVTHAPRSPAACVSQSVSQSVRRGGAGVQWPLPPLRHLTCSVVTDSPDRSRVLGGGAAHLVPGRLLHPIQGGLRLPITLGGGANGPEPSAAPAASGIASRTPVTGPRRLHGGDQS
ncbi:unnamed protein product [Caretta caretta]